MPSKFPRRNSVLKLGFKKTAIELVFEILMKIFYNMGCFQIIYFLHDEAPESTLQPECNVSSWLQNAFKMAKQMKN